MLTASPDHSVFYVLFSRSIQASIGPVSIMLSVSLNIVNIFIPWSKSRMCNVQWLRTYWCKSALHLKAERKGSVVWIYFTAVNENDCTLLVKMSFLQLNFADGCSEGDVTWWQLSTPNCPPHVQWMNLDEATPPTVAVLSSADFFFFWLGEREQGGLLAAGLFPLGKLLYSHLTLPGMTEQQS